MSEKYIPYISINIGLALGISNKLLHCSQERQEKHWYLCKICFDNGKPHKSQRVLAFAVAIVNKTISTCFDCLDSCNIRLRKNAINFVL